MEINPRNTAFLILKSLEPLILDYRMQNTPEPEMRRSGWLRFRAGSWALCPPLSWLLLRAVCVYKSLRLSPLAKEGLIKEEVHLALAQRSLKPPKTWGDAGSRIPGAHGAFAGWLARPSPKMLPWLVVALWSQHPSKGPSGCLSCEREACPAAAPGGRGRRRRGAGGDVGGGGAHLSLPETALNTAVGFHHYLPNDARSSCHGVKCTQH